MTRETINTSLSPEIFIDAVQGNLQIKGWEAPQVAVRADPAELDLQEHEDVVRLSCRGDCDLRLPYGASLQIESVHGDAQIKQLEESLTIGTVHGSLELRRISGAQIGLVHGDLSVKNATGDLQLAQLLGDAEIRQVQGDCKLTQVQGDLDVQDVEGSLEVHATGNVRLHLNVMLGSDYRVQSEGDVVCSIPQEADLKVSLISAGKSIKVRLPDQSQIYHQEQLELALGDGEAAFMIHAGGDIVLMGEETTWEAGASLPDFSQQIAHQVEAQIGSQLEEITRQMNAQMSRLSETLAKAGMSEEDSQRIIDQAMKVSERETARAQEKLHRAQEKLERKLESAHRRAEQKAQAAERAARSTTRRSWGRDRHSWSVDIPMPSPASPATPASEPVSEEERLMILRMLEQKKISMEEANQLLTALEGKE